MCSPERDSSWTIDTFSPLDWKGTNQFEFIGRRPKTNAPPPRFVEKKTRPEFMVSRLIAAAEVRLFVILALIRFIFGVFPA
jgi:hypothetical protein